MEEKDPNVRLLTEILAQRDVGAPLPSTMDSDGSLRSIEIKRTLQGWRLVAVDAILQFGLLLAIIETSITATALVSISNYFNNSVNATWVVLAYLLSYMAFATIFARASDGLGRKEATMVAWLIFGGFSLGCGLAKTLNQLIAFRVLQGIGGSGLYAMTMVAGPEITPVEYWGISSSILGLTIATGSVLGPILGGVITTKADWRWIYLYNAPCALVGTACLLVFWPCDKKATRISLQSLRKVDFFGAVLLLAASTLLVFALQEAGSKEYAWSDRVIVSTLVLSGACWLVFFSWITWLSLGNGTFRMRAILPLQVAFSRPTGPAIVAVFLTGFPWFIAVINLPQRFQIVNGNSPIKAGVHLLPLLCAMAFGGGLGGALSSVSRRNFTSHTMIIAACSILLGCGLMSTLSNGTEFPRAVYGYQFILGLGIGLTFSSGTMMIALANSPENVAAAQGALSQARILGGSIGLAMATIIVNHKFAVDLPKVLDPVQIRNLERLLGSIASLSPSDQAAVATVYTEAFNQQMRVCTYLAAACVLAALATFQQKPAGLDAMMVGRERESNEPDSSG